MKVTVDAPDLNTLAADLHERAGAVGKDSAAVVRKGALKIKNEARTLASGIAHAPAYPFSISYDIHGDGRFLAVEAEIGPDKDKRQGALGNILEYGTVKNAPLAHLGPALDREGPNFEAAMLALGVQGLT